MSSATANLLLDVDVLTSSLVKKKMAYFPVPSKQAWRTDILLELIDAKLWKTNIENFEKEDLILIINHLCTS